MNHGPETSSPVSVRPRFASALSTATDSLQAANEVCKAVRGELDHMRPILPFSSSRRITWPRWSELPA